MESFTGDIIILYICTKSHNLMMHGFCDMQCDRLWTVFCRFISLWTTKINFLQKWKKTWRYYYFINVYHKCQSYDILFFRNGVQQTKCFVILDHFLPFYHLVIFWKIKIWKTEENPWRYHNFTQVYQKS